MFFLSHIWKRCLSWAVLTSVLALGLTAFATPARAAGETYTWGDTSFGSIKASTGSFDAPVTFTKSGDTSGGGATFQGSGTYTCNNQSKTGNFTLTVAGTDYHSGKPDMPTSATLVPADSNCARFTINTTIAASTDGGTNVTGPTATNNSPPDCDQGSFTWLFCPVIDNIAGGVTSLAKDVLVPMLEVNRITPSTTPGLYHAWQNLMYLAEALLIFVFFVIIFATMTQQDIGFFDQYTIKKMMPRLVIAAILMQFSFVISGFIVDVGNVTGSGIETILTTALDPSKGAPSLSNLVENLVTGAAGVVAGTGATLVVLTSWDAALPILLSLLISLMVVFLTLGARFLIIAVLVVVSPLAIVAWILPNTEHYFHDWRKVFTRLVLMYPIVVGVLTLAGSINEVLSFGGGNGSTADSGGATVALAIIKPLVVIAAFLIIPVSFKLAGRGLDRVHGLLSGAGQAGKGALKSSDMWQRGKEEREARKNTYSGRVLNSKTITSLQSKDSKMAHAAAGLMSGGAALALLKAPGNKTALQRSNSAIINRTQKQLGELKEGKNPVNLLKALRAANGDEEATKDLRKNAPDLLRFSSTAPGREAIFNSLVDTEFANADTLDQFRIAKPKKGLARLGTHGNLAAEYTSLRDAGQAKRNQLPTIVQRLREDQKDYKVTDRAGNVLEVIPELKMGMPDVNGIAKSFSKATAAEISKHSPDVYEMMLATIDPKASVDQRRAAQLGALGMAVGADPRQMARVFNATDRSPGAIEKRLMMAQALRANVETVWSTRTEYKETFDSVVGKIMEDDKMTVQLAKKAGATDADLSRLSNQGRAYVIHEWMNNSKYEFKDATKGMSSADINVRGAELIKNTRLNERFQKRLENERTSIPKPDEDRRYDSWKKNQP